MPIPLFILQLFYCVYNFSLKIESTVRLWIKFNEEVFIKIICVLDKFKLCPSHSFGM